MNRHIPDVNQLYAGFVLSGYVCFREIMPCPPEQHNFVACTISNRNAVRFLIVLERQIRLMGNLYNEVQVHGYLLQVKALSL